jgi:hypothetical protein
MGAAQLPLADPPSAGVPLTGAFFRTLITAPTKELSLYSNFYSVVSVVTPRILGVI